MGERTIGNLCKGVVREGVKVEKLTVRDLTVSSKSERV